MSKTNDSSIQRHFIKLLHHLDQEVLCATGAEVIEIKLATRADEYNALTGDEWRRTSEEVIFLAPKARVS